MSAIQIKSALISVFDKEGLEPIIKELSKSGVTFYSTGGTQKYIESLGEEVIAVESLTSYPSIFGGRVKTLHPKVFGGILYRRGHEGDEQESDQYDIPAIDLVIVDLYPFEDTVASGAAEQDIIEKIDIGGISLIRAAAKNFKDVTIVASKGQYNLLLDIISSKGGKTDLEDRKMLAAHAFNVSSHYDTAIFNYFNEEAELPALKVSEQKGKTLRYGENPHQEGTFYGNLEELFDQLHGKELSYNNLVDIDAAIGLIDEFTDKPAMAILKHNNACGMATGSDITEAYKKALEADPVSAFGGVLASNTTIDKSVAEELNSLFFEVLIAPDFDDEAMKILTTKKNRVLLKRKEVAFGDKTVKTLLNGYLEQDKDLKTESEEDLTVVTDKQPTEEEIASMLFANKICKHTKSNTIVFAKEGQLFASGVGQTSRVDALKQAVEKAKSFGFDLSQAVMASDAFFPFPDCVELADKEGIKAVIQPGGSIRDKESIEYCNKNNMSMVTTGIRHFKH